jgi:hypothetical protein
VSLPKIGLISEPNHCESLKARPGNNYCSDDGYTQNTEVYPQTFLEK